MSSALHTDNKPESAQDAQGASPLWPADNPAVTAHMNLLQGIINRLANNSAGCKTWCLTLAGGLVSLAGATHVAQVVKFALVPILIFGFMDTMYLAQEKAYRDLYGRIVNAIRSGSYTLSSAYDAEATVGAEHIGSAIASWSILPVYIGLIFLYLTAQFAGLLAI